VALAILKARSVALTRSRCNEPFSDNNADLQDVRFERRIRGQPTIVPRGEGGAAESWETALVATMKQVEKRILRVDGFAVGIRHGRDNRDVRSDKST
jgi:hypothetical protein